LGTGGLHTLHGPYRAAASFRGIGILLRARYRQPARWYLAPVRVTYTVTSSPPVGAMVFGAGITEDNAALELCAEELALGSGLHLLQGLSPLASASFRETALLLFARNRHPAL
jgi:hypothetical protein